MQMLKSDYFYNDIIGSICSGLIYLILNGCHLVPLAMFCDYYNNEGECEWHYKPCGAPCMKTCRNPSGRCAYHLPGLEGEKVFLIICMPISAI